MNAAEAGRLADGLCDYLTREHPEVAPRLERNDRDAMDMGASIALVLGTPALVALAKGIAAYIKRRGGPTLVIRSDGREITVDGKLSDATMRDLIMEALKR